MAFPPVPRGPRDPRPEDVVIRIPVHRDLGLLLKQDTGELEQALRKLAADAMSEELRRICDKLREQA